MRMKKPDSYLREAFVEYLVDRFANEVEKHVANAHFENIVEAFSRMTANPINGGTSIGLRMSRYSFALTFEIGDGPKESGELDNDPEIVAKYTGWLSELKVGDRVLAMKDLDPDGSNVKEGTVGTVIRKAGPGELGDGPFGPLVEWDSGGACNVYNGDVVKASIRS